MSITYDFFTGSYDDFPQSTLQSLFREFHRGNLSVDDLVREVPLYEDLQLSVSLAAATSGISHPTGIIKKIVPISPLCNQSSYLFCQDSEEKHAVHHVENNQHSKNEKSKRGIFFVVDGVSVGYLKSNGFTTFLATQTIKNDADELQLVQGGMYVLPDYSNCWNSFFSNNFDSRWLVAEVDSIRVEPGRLIIPAICERYLTSHGINDSLLDIFSLLNRQAEHICQTRTSSDTMKYIGKLNHILGD